MNKLPPVRQLASRDNPLMVRLRKLAREPAAYRRQGEVLLSGEHLCDVLLRVGTVPQIALLTAEAWSDPRWRDRALHAREVIVLPEPLLRELQQLDSPAPLAFTASYTSATAVHVDAPTLVLDRLQDTGNVGTLLRSAAAFGIRQVLALTGTAALWSPKVLRAGMGAHFGLHVIEGAAADAGVSTLRVPLIATSSHAPTAVHDTPLPWPCAWVVGHEGQGVDMGLARRCALTVRIPQPGGEESLNVSVAAAICFYESARQRGALSATGPLSARSVR